MEKFEGYDKETFFNEKVEHERDLFQYTYPLYKFLCDDTNRTKRQLKKIFKDKNILLIGGGASQIGFTLSCYNANPKRIVNVDPYTRAKELRNTEIVRQDFLQTDYINEFDESLALWSLPMYLKLRQIPKFWKKSIVATAPKGNLRVHPICIMGGFDETDMDKKYFARNMALIEKIKREFPETNPQIFSTGVYTTATMQMPDNKRDINRFCELELK